MSFPSSPRVVYAKNPLEEVIFQVRFPVILRIAKEKGTTFFKQPSKPNKTSVDSTKKYQLT